MTPAEINSLVEQVSAAIGDQPLGVPLVTTRDGGATSVTYQGARGLYDIAGVEGKVVVIHADPVTHQVSGFYNLTPEDADNQAATLVGHLLSVESLVFVIGYMSADPLAVNWKLFRTGQSELRFMTRRVPTSQPPYTQGEIVVGDLVVGFRHRADGVVDDIRQLTRSELQGL